MYKYLAKINVVIEIYEISEKNYENYLPEILHHIPNPPLLVGLQHPQLQIRSKGHRHYFLEAEARSVVWDTEGVH